MSKTSCAFLEVPNGMFCILEVLHVVFCIFGRNSQDVFEILRRIFGSSLWDFVPFWKFLVGFCAFLENPGGILCIFGSSSWDFVHYSKSIMGFCGFSEDHRGILCII